MMNIHDKLAREQQENWALLYRCYQKAHNDLLMALRLFAAELLYRKDPEADRIEVRGQLLVKFADNATLQTYVEQQLTKGTWGDDPILYTILSALGYQPIMHLADTDFPSYMPFEQKNPDISPRIDLVNHGAKTGGYHWERRGQSNPGGGDCMYWSVAQQIVQEDSRFNLTKAGSLKKSPVTVHELIKQDSKSHSSADRENTSVKKASSHTAQVKISSTKASVKSPSKSHQQAKVVSPNKEESSLAQHHAKLFKTYQERDEKRYHEAHAQLVSLSLEQLISIRQMLIQYTSGDSYIARRHLHMIKEHGHSKIADIFETGKAANDLELLLAKEELCHMIAREAWCDPRSHRLILDEIKVEAPSLSSSAPALQAKV